MSRVYKGVVPPGGRGWYFPEPTIPQPVLGGNYEELITNITNVRIHNNIKIGHVEKDFEVWFCREFPSFCDPISREVSPEPETDDPTKILRERVSSFAGNRYQHAGSIELESADEANRRASICSTCPENQDWKDSCPCVETTERTIVLLTQNQETTPSLKGKGCKVTGQSNEAAVWFEPKLLNHRKRYMDKLPDFCWLRDLEEAK